MATASASLGAAFGAAFLAMAGALFGVLFARMVWADDLKHAQQIDEIRSGTERALKSRIKSQEEIIAVLKGRLGE